MMRPPKAAVPSRNELVLLLAGLMALNALAIDIVLPAFGMLDEAFGLAHENQRQQIVIVYVLGLGLSQLFWGPLLDRFGRKPVLGLALVAYVIAGVLCVLAPSFSTLLMARFAQGAAAGATRIASSTIVRDLYSGRQMAQLMSIVMLVFMMVPALAPEIGRWMLMVSADWRIIFWTLVVYGAVVGAWAMMRLPETLQSAYRLPINMPSVLASYRAVVAKRESLGYMIAGAFVFAVLFSYISASQQLFDEVFNRGEVFTRWFAAIALCMGLSNLINSRLVMTIGMRRLSHGAVVGLIFVNVLYVLMSVTVGDSFYPFIAALMGNMFLIGFMGANFTALAMEPQADRAGVASSAYGFTTTFGSGVMGGLIASGFNGTALPIFVGNALCAIGALVAIYHHRTRTFVPSGSPIVIASDQELKAEPL